MLILVTCKEALAGKNRQLSLGYQRGAIFLPCLFWLLFLTKKKSNKRLGLKINLV